MIFSDKRNFTRWFIILSSFFIVVLIIWNTYNFFQIFKEEERIKVKLWATAQKTLANANEYTDVDLPLELISTNTSIPMLLTDKNDSIINHNNIDDDIASDKDKLQKLFLQLKSENKPIQMILSVNEYQNIYYGNSPLLNKLKYYPIALLLIIFLFAAVVYNFYRATKMATQNKLWAGMAKETAHQIGTPLSSLIGWLELLKTEDIDSTTLEEIEKDINRLQTITDRFSKIGSEPHLEKTNIVLATQQAFEYLKLRSSKQITYHFNSTSTELLSDINPSLHSWTIENLVKNGIDAMKGKGEISILIEEKDKWIKIKISDTGKGIPKTQFNKIFEPGFTTKKRGWGLGLSLTKRIVNDYHKGNIKVEHSEVGKGTTFEIKLPKKTI